ncbi:hypothetical protein N7388_21770 [Stutzerimonas stutzeri]|jgi:hypothetical protein|uniref:Uncharacterized protein n=1 Tax=Stutzerimonas stutzeri TaxID=316 RepID=A0AA40RUR5_STUST|nr:hypothetical protein [Stutzerimonas stutzeri]MBA1305874.1 hypothetical protein [Stutzerimonas stutzeri]MCQ4227656.1 hypothetical protein [Stutzerimonas stutzeri]MDH0446291.1 hypothetical protein [Stutzerimonas stutzeri]
MSEASLLEQIIVLSWAFLAVTGGFNGMYICFHGIGRFDRHFSSLNDFKKESYSPFDRFCRMHRYSFQYVFGINRPAISLPLKVWLIYTCISLIFLWLSMAIGQLNLHFGFNPLK